MTQSSMTDINGRLYAKDLKPGDKVETDDGFTCLPTGAVRVVQSHPNGLWIACEEGKHFLAGQEDLDGNLIGIYKL